MKISQIENSKSAIEISDIDLSAATKGELLQIGKLVVEHLIVVIRNQNLTPEREVEICAQIGTVEYVPAEIFHRCPIDAKGNFVSGVQRVTGMRHPDGTPMGLFGHDDDLDWHANRPSAEMERKPLIWLYSVSGSRGSKTSWCNCAAAYEDLDSETKDEISGLKGIYGFEPGAYTSFTEFKRHRNLNGINFVVENPLTKKKGMFFPFLQLFGFKDRSEEYSKALIARLTAHVLQPQYIYHHLWEDGDVVISEQWHSIHKRWACDVSQRLLHRISFGYDHLLKSEPSTVRQETGEAHCQS